MWGFLHMEGFRGRIFKTTKTKVTVAIIWLYSGQQFPLLFKFSHFL